MAELRPEGYPKLENYHPTRFMLPTSHYDPDRADRAVRFIEMLRHTKGKWAGKRFWLLPWQEQIIRDVFGIVDENGHRQFRTAYVEIGKKNGKSELAAAVALYLLYADGEPSAEVYGAAADRQQASIVFDVARQMVDMTPALVKRSKMVQDLEGMGFTVVPFGQGFKDMSPPTKEFYKLLMEGRIIHGGNPVMRWMAGNVVVDRDPAENIKPTKAKSPEKIDGVVAAIMALDRCIRHEQQGSVYDDRGLLVF